MINLSIESVSYTYDKNRVFENVSLSFNKGSLVGLIGPNGAGKTTLMHLLMDLLSVETGKITINNKKISDIKKRDLAKLITLVPQDNQIAYSFTVEELVAMGRNPWLGRFEPLKREDQKIIDYSMQKTQVEHFAKKSIAELSGGERQRVLIARAIAQQTPIILLDEATANLDICHQLEILELLKQLAKDGHLIIAAIHDLGMASRYCDRVILLADKTIQADGHPDKVITTDNLKTYYNLEAFIQPIKNNDFGGLNILPIKSSHAANERISNIKYLN